MLNILESIVVWAVSVILCDIWKFYCLAREQSQETTALTELLESVKQRAMELCQRTYTNPNSTSSRIRFTGAQKSLKMNLELRLSLAESYCYATRHATSVMHYSSLGIPIPEQLHYTIWVTSKWLRICMTWLSVLIFAWHIEYANRGWERRYIVCSLLDLHLTSSTTIAFILFLHSLRIT